MNYQFLSRDNQFEPINDSIILGQLNCRYKAGQLIPDFEFKAFTESKGKEYIYNLRVLEVKKDLVLLKDLGEKHEIKV